MVRGALDSDAPSHRCAECDWDVCSPCLARLGLLGPLLPCPAKPGPCPAKPSPHLAVHMAQVLVIFGHASVAAVDQWGWLPWQYAHARGDAALAQHLHAASTHADTHIHTDSHCNRGTDAGTTRPSVCAAEGVRAPLPPPPPATVFVFDDAGDADEAPWVSVTIPTR